jgi:hypothetical protein
MPPNKGRAALRWCYRCSCGPFDECWKRPKKKKKEKKVIVEPEVKLTESEERDLKEKIISNFYWNNPKEDT